MNIDDMVRSLAAAGQELHALGALDAAAVTALNREFEHDMCFGSRKRIMEWKSMLCDYKEQQLRDAARQ